MSTGTSELPPLANLFSEPSRWTKEHYAKDSHGVSTFATADNAVCFCLLGGVRLCYDFLEVPEIEMKLENVLAARGFSGSLANWNDAPKRTVEEVVALCIEAGV